VTRKTPEGRFNEELNKKLEARFPGCEILKLDPMTNYQGIPDKLVVYEGHAGFLETKSGFKAKNQPNQPYHVDRLGSVGFSAFINPDNCDEVLDGLHKAFGAEG
jgi:hypothetical protein